MPGRRRDADCDTQDACAPQTSSESKRLGSRLASGRGFADNTAQEMALAGRPDILLKMKPTHQSYDRDRHREVGQVAKRLLDQQQPNQECLAFAATVMWYFAMEGYLNWLCEMIKPILSEDERKTIMPKCASEHKCVSKQYRGTMGKIRFLSEKLKLPPWDENIRPFRTINTLKTIRHMIVHPKCKRGNRLAEDKDNSLQLDQEDSICALATKEFARLARQDVEAIAMQLHQAAQKECPLRILSVDPFEGFVAHRIWNIR